MRNVSVLSLSFAVDDAAPVRGGGDILRMIGDNLNGTEDVVLLPEMCLGSAISEEGDPFLSGISALAARNGVYILAAVNRKIGEGRHANSAILYDRGGGVALCYDKMYPYWSEYDRTDSAVIPGDRAVFADTDFGRVSAAICFDANFADLWRDIAELDADLVLFTSAYSAGRQLSAHALNHHYAIVTATRKPDFAVYDVDGRERTYNRGAGDRVLASRARVDLDKVLCHHNFNRDRIAAMLREHPDEVELEHDYEREEWCVIRSIAPDADARALCGEYGIESLRDYQRRSRAHTDAARGHPPVRPYRI